MEGGAGVDKSVDRFLSMDEDEEFDFPLTPRPAKIPRFQPKSKGKAKVTDFSPAPKAEAAASATGVKHSTETYGARLPADGTEEGVGDSMEVDEGDDAVIREISVFCGLGNIGEDARLYVMQHVLRGAWRSYELNEGCEQVRMKPKQSKIELDLRMDRANENYNQVVPKTLKLQKQTLSSSEVSSGIQYAVGVLAKDKFHLNPVHAVLQLRPSLAHLCDDFDDLPAKDIVSKAAGASTKSLKEKVDSKNSNESAVDNEPWVLLGYHFEDSFISNEYKQKMVAEGHGHLLFIMKPPDYLHFLPSGDLADKKGGRVPSVRSLLRMPLDERLKKWFCQVNQVNRFDVLKHLAHGYSDDELLKVLLSYAFLVQGLWVCKSSLLYDGAEAMQRDYILLIFNRMDTIQYQKLKEIKHKSSGFKSMMNALAYERKYLGDWKFKESTDFSFMKRYPNIVQGQENAWLGRENLILDSVHKLREKIPQMTRHFLASNIVKTSSACKAFTNRVRDGIGNLTGQMRSTETLEHLPKALLEIFNIQKVRSLPSILRGLREMALFKSSRPKEDQKTRLLVNAAANAVSLPEEDLRSVIGQVAVGIHGVYVLNFAGNPVLDPLRNVVINLFRDKEPNVKLRKEEIKQAAQISLRREISDSEYNQVIHELCVSIKGAWKLRSGDEA